ncbi:hypothetical protein [Dyella sp. 20L07]
MENPLRETSARMAGGAFCGKPFGELKDSAMLVGGRVDQHHLPAVYL